MIYLGFILQLVEFTLCIFYDAIILIVIPECAEAIAFHLKIATSTYVSAEEQIRSLRSVIVYALLVVVITGIILIRCGNRLESYLLCQEKTPLCCKCWIKERERYERGYCDQNVIGFTDSARDCSHLQS